MSRYGYYKLVKSEPMEDWFLIEQEEHAHTEQLLRVKENVMSLWTSGRICDADVEGYAVEMLAIANAIEKRERITFKRCAVDARDPQEIRFWSPRNSQMHAVTYDTVADDLAKQIRALVTLPVSPEASR